MAAAPDWLGGHAAPMPAAAIGGGTLSLAEIAKLPGAGRSAELVRRWYDPQFGIGPEPGEDVDALPRWSVSIEFTRIVEDDIVIEVSAPDMETARKLARQEVEDHESGEIEFGNVVARRLDQPRVAA